MSHSGPLGENGAPGFTLYPIHARPRHRRSSVVLALAGMMATLTPQQIDSIGAHKPYLRGRPNPVHVAERIESAQAKRDRKAAKKAADAISRQNGGAL